ncbi:MAG: oligoribonuclease [Kistimonas sp.]|nr:oligoribonuclease [Kistimonas sp.]
MTQEVSRPVPEEVLVWIDLEMTGLDPEVDKIIEIATLVTDSRLNLLATGPAIAVYQPDSVLDAMGPWCVKTHGATGLTESVRQSRISTAQAEAMTLEFLAAWSRPGLSPMCGNTVGQDRRFLRRYMPELHSFFHYRNIDVSTLKELARRWKPELLKQQVKTGTHRALDDILESVTELAFYRENFTKV